MALRDGASYHGEIAVFISRQGPDFVFFDGNPVYINAFTYFIPMQGEADFISDGTVFTKFFRRQAGMTPQKYRKLNMEGGTETTGTTETADI